MRAQLDPWRALPGDERRLLVQLAVLLPVIGGALRWFGLRRTYRLLGGAERPAASDTDGAEDSQTTAQRLVRLASIASRHGPYGATCLPQSLTVWWLLRRRGLAAELRIGVGKAEEHVRAHAWVELAGRAINNPPSIAEEFVAYRDLGRRLPGSLRIP